MGALYLGCTNLRRIGGVHDRLGTRLVPCRQCFNCSRNRARDWVGRIIAESRVAQRTLFATFTVGNSTAYSYPELEMDRRATSLNRIDCEEYVDRERKYLRPGKMRMFYVGEYGSEKGRAHYHFIQFFYGCDGPEDIILDWRYFRGKYPEGFTRPGMTHIDGDKTYWPWGYVFYREFHPRDAHYCAKYATKGSDVEWQEMKQLEKACFRLKENTPYPVKNGEGVRGKERTPVLHFAAHEVRSVIARGVLLVFFL